MLKVVQMPTKGLSALSAMSIGFMFFSTKKKKANNMILID